MVGPIGIIVLPDTQKIRKFVGKNFMKVTIPYTPRKQQAFIHKELDKHRFSVLCCHRRFGKTVMLINHLIKCCMMNKNHHPRFAYIAPTYSQAKKIAWDYLKFYTKGLPIQSIMKQN